ncbi:MAG: ABC transporter permease [Clostridia bacterium]|nr:ABC transporter permease [Clostridia bacterium]
MKKAYYKDSRKMLKNNLFRFISIVLIIMLGTTFFIGMNAVSPEMKQSAQNYMEDNNVFDISLVSNMGYDTDDLDKFKKIDNIIEVQGVYTYDVLAKFGEKDLAIRLSSIMNNSEMNQNNITEGKNIEEDTDCLISSRLVDMYGYKVGDTIKFYLNDDSNIEDTLAYTEFKIVGITQNPMYLSKFYGNTKLLSGELNGYVMVKDDVFKSENYSYVYIKTDIDNKLDKFSDEYKDKLDKILPDVEKINKEISEEKYKKIYEQASSEISTAESKLTLARNYVKDLKNNINNSQLQINSSIKQVALGISAYYNSYSLASKIEEKEKIISDLYNSLNQKNQAKIELEKTFNELTSKRISANSRT